MHWRAYVDDDSAEAPAWRGLYGATDVPLRTIYYSGGMAEPERAQAGGIPAYFVDFAGLTALGRSFVLQRLQAERGITAFTADVVLRQPRPGALRLVVTPALQVRVQLDGARTDRTYLDAVARTARSHIERGDLPPPCAHPFLRRQAGALRAWLVDRQYADLHPVMHEAVGLLQEILTRCQPGPRIAS